MKAKEIRQKARESMSGKWGKFVGMNLLYLVIQFVCVAICFIPIFSTAVTLLADGASALASGSNAIIADFEEEVLTSVINSVKLCYVLLLAVLVLTVPLTYSLIKNIVDLKRGDVKATQFFKQWLKYFGRAWKVSLWKIWKVLSVYLIFVAAVIGISILSAVFTAIGLGAISILFVLCIVVGLIAMEVVMIRRLFAMALSEYVAIDNEELTAKESVNKSMELMNGYKWKLFCLIFSFIGWAILSAITFGIGYLFLTPYMQVSLVCFYESILEDKGEGIKEDVSVAETVPTEVITQE